MQPDKCQKTAYSACLKGRTGDAKAVALQIWRTKNNRNLTFFTCRTLSKMSGINPETNFIRPNSMSTTTLVATKSIFVVQTKKSCHNLGHVPGWGNFNYFVTLWKKFLIWTLYVNIPRLRAFLNECEPLLLPRWRCCSSSLSCKPSCSCTTLVVVSKPFRCATTKAAAT